MLIDVHAHLTDEKFNDLDKVLERAKESNVNKIICSAYDLSSSLKAVQLSVENTNVFANIGLHPENVGEIKEGTFALLEKLAREKKVVAIGEIGLDYHYTQDNKEFQKEIFIKQIELANKLNLPIVIHSRDAIEDTIKILKKHRPNKESLIHCFGGSVESAKVLVGMGFSFSFGGVITFSNAKKAVEVVESLPIEKLMLETDCPYLTPEPYRGKRNEPKNVVYVADKIAKIKGLSFEAVVEITTKNAERVFNL